MNRKYVLAIKRNNNDYLPLEWHLTPFYNGQDMSTLAGIDNFTRSIKKVDLIITITELNLYGLNELFRDFVIIYQEKGRIRELKDGVIFSNDDVISSQELIDFILSNMSDKKLINRIYNICASIKEESIGLEKFKLALNNLDFFKNNNPEAPRLALASINEMSYDVRRSLLVRVSEKVIGAYEDEMKKVKENKMMNDSDIKVA